MVNKNFYALTFQWKRTKVKRFKISLFKYIYNPGKNIFFFLRPYGYKRIRARFDFGKGIESSVDRTNNGSGTRSCEIQLGHAVASRKFGKIDRVDVVYVWSKKYILAPTVCGKAVKSHHFTKAEYAVYIDVDGGKIPGDISNNSRTTLGKTNFLAGDWFDLRSLDATLQDRQRQNIKNHNPFHFDTVKVTFAKSTYYWRFCLLQVEMRSKKTTVTMSESIDR